MKKAIYIFMALMLLQTSCSSDDVIPHSDAPVSITVSCRPMVNGRTTRAVWDDVPTPEYPAQLIVVSSAGDAFAVTMAGDADNTGYVAYHTSSKVITDLEASQMSFTAYAPSVWKDVPAISACDYLSGNGTYNWNKAHLMFELKHATALLRFRFAVDENYDKSRQVVITGFSVNGTDIAIKGNKALLSTTMACEAICYVNPYLLKKGDALNLLCKYDVYDKDGTDAGDLVRGGVTASNSLTIGKPGSSIQSLDVAHYYDFNITIDPTYMYVLSEHDNNHMKIQ